MSPRAPRWMGRGTTLIEAMISIAVLIVGMLAILSASIAISRQTQIARKRTVAAELARELGEYLRGQPFSSPLLTCTVAGCTAPSPLPPTMTLSGTTVTFNPDPGVHNENDPSNPLAGLSPTGLGYVKGLSDSAGATLAKTRYWRVWYVSAATQGFRAISVYVFYDNSTGGQDVVEHHTGTYDPAALGSAVLGASAL